MITLFNVLQFIAVNAALLYYALILRELPKNYFKRFSDLHGVLHFSIPCALVAAYCLGLIMNFIQLHCVEQVLMHADLLIYAVGKLQNKYFPEYANYTSNLILIWIGAAAFITLYTNSLLLFLPKLHLLTTQIQVALLFTIFTLENYSRSLTTISAAVIQKMLFETIIIAIFATEV